MDRRVIGIYKNENLRGYVESQLNIISSLGVDTVLVHADDTFYDERFGITRFPTFLFMKGESLVTRKTGKFLDNTLVNQLSQLRWI